MSILPSIAISRSQAKPRGSLAFLVAEGAGLPGSAAEWNGNGRIEAALKVSEFKGTHSSLVEILAPSEGIDRIVVAGIGKQADLTPDRWMKIGGKVFNACRKSAALTVFTDLDGTKEGAGHEAVAALAMGATLRAYTFDTYKTKKEGKEAKPLKMTLVTASDAKAKAAWKSSEAVAGGVMLARDLVNEPANILGPVEFADRAARLRDLGCEVIILDEKKLKSMKMNALLGVAQGSVRPPRVAIMRWNGGKAKDKPVAFVGKGVVFDTGGISIKPAAGMEDMKGDMGGAAAVCGVMHALAARKARVNAVGVIGLVENMPDGNAQRPGDIVTSKSGQTIEVLNTDAEGRLVLADLLWMTEEDYKPQFMINLATLTGAIMIALGQQHAGLFSNDDELAARLTSAGIDTEERVWRMPLSADYDKLIDSKNADMKNIGGRYGGSITAAQFLKRFVRDVPWAHLDIAGTAMGSPQNDYSKGWASGYGVRLLDRLVSEHYE